MIDTQAIRNKILDLAMRGQLTEQLPEDGTAEELFQKIQANRLKSDKSKPIQNINNEDIPFDIPSNWMWIRLGGLVDVLGGKRIPAGRKLTTENTGHKYIRVSDMKEMSVDTSNLMYVPDDIYPSISRYIIKKEDVYITVAGTIGRVGTIPDELDGANLTENADRLVFSLLDKKWLVFCLASSVVQKQIDLLTTQVAQPKLAIKRIQEFCIPLPPLAEQQRIVDKIDQAFTVLDTIDALQAQYADNLTALKNKLIDAAIQGNLTEKLPEDGTAEELYQQIQTEKQALIKAGKIKKEKPLPEISDDEIPFDIPENWKWVRLSSVIDVRDGTHDTPKYYDQGIPLVTSKNLSSGKLDFSDVKLISLEDAEKINERSHVERGDILFAMIGTIGNPVIVDTDREFCIKNVALFKRFHGTQFNMEYLLYYLLKEQNELKKISLGGLQPFVSLKLFRAHPFPLPPLNEQNRIVVVLKDILLLCEG